MMKHRIRILSISSLLVWFSVPLLAAQPEPQQVTTHTVNMGKGCKIRMQLPQGASIDVRRSPESSFRGKAWIRFTPPAYFHYPYEQAIIPIHCRDDSGGEYSGYVRFDEAKQIWLKDREALQNVVDVAFSPKRKKALERSFRLQQLTTPNASGYAFTIDDVTGEKKLRTKKLDFSLIHGRPYERYKHLSGGGIMMYVNNPKNRDLTPYLMPFLQTIEFLKDDPTEAGISTEKTDCCEN